MTMALRPLTGARSLARELRMEPKTLLQRLGWVRQHKRLRWELDEDLPGELAAGQYEARSVSSCMVPATIAAALAVERGVCTRLVDPDPPALRPSSSSGPATAVVAVLAHVDHGKTTLLDRLMGTSVTAREVGGITQCVRPTSLLPLADRTAGSALRAIAFIDTPGHQAFHSMRGAAADSADLALVLVAVDAGVQPQTREVVRRCARRGQPVLFAISKADLLAPAGAPPCDPRAPAAAGGLAFAAETAAARALRAELLELWRVEREGAAGQPTGRPGSAVGAGDADAPPEVVLISARQGMGLAELLQAVARTLQRRAAFGASGEQAGEEEAAAVVIETSAVKGLGVTVLAVVRAGTLRPSQWFVCGSRLGKVRQLLDASPREGGGGAGGGAGGGGSGGGAGEPELRRAPEGTPVRVVASWGRDAGDGGRFEVGDELRVLPEARARELAAYRQAAALFRALRCAPSAREAAAAAPAEADDQGGVAAAAAAAAALASAGVAPHAPEAAAAVAADVAAEVEAIAAGGAPQPCVGAVVRVAHAGELQAVLDFLKPRVPSHRVQLLNFGVGPPSRIDLTVCRSAASQGLPAAIYTFNQPVSAALRAEARRAHVPLREFVVLHELLTDLLRHAGLPGPARELARMADDAPERLAGGTRDGG